MTTIDLNGTWALRAASKEAVPGSLSFDQVPVSIPGDNLSALVSAGLISDPYFGRNELDLQWIGRTDWVFERQFNLEDADAKAARIVLSFDSIDTVAEVRVNGHQVGSSDNMFVRRQFDIGSSVQPGKNTISVLVRSAEKVAAERAAALTYSIPHTPAPVYSPHRNLVRKVQCHAGWDWGPCLMVSGLYGNVVIEATEDSIEYVTTDLHRAGDDWKVRVRVDYISAAGGSIEVAARVASAEVKQNVVAVPGKNRFDLTVDVHSPELWWPVGYGKQPLYELSVRAGALRALKRIGFRTIEVKAEDDALGRTMTVRVNDRDVFCKGGNWIPMDAMPARHTRERYERLISDSVQANMNMIRVWGGGQYENEAFYDLCDEKGVLIWHDMMFSCSLYPSSKEFLDSVREEITHQVMRLKDHPSIALWCGNNEDVGAMTWFEESRNDPGRYIVDYDRLNEGVIGDVVRTLDPRRPWWPSSPSAGPDDFTDCWHTSGRGDMHYWSVWHEGKPFSAYYDITPRFCSEFGYQSFPSLESVISYAPQEEWNLTSPTLEHHQKNDRGNSIIIENFSRYFRFPEGFANMLYLSQVQQALAMKTAVEYWRSLRPVCMGTLYWQINDNWPVASWASIEYSGKWKLLHYTAKRFYQPITVVAYLKGTDISVFGLNDTEDPITGSVVYRFVRFSGAVESQREERVTLAPEAATRLWTGTIAELPFRIDEGVFAVEFNATAGGKTVRSANDLFLTEPKRCSLADPKLDVAVGRNTSGQLEVTLSSAAPAFYASLDIDSSIGRFSDNCVSVYPDRPVSLEFVPADSARGVDVEEIRRALTVFHLRSTYT